MGAGVNALKVNGPINAIGISANGNIYAGGYGTNSFGFTNLVEWNGVSWREIFNAGFSVNNPVRSIYVDKAGNVYAAGDFKNNGEGEFGLPACCGCIGCGDHHQVCTHNGCCAGSYTHIRY